jgi:hypothetical protein
MKLYPYFIYFSFDLVKLSVWDVHKFLRSDYDFCKIHIYCLIWVKFGLIRDMNIMLVSICESYDNGDTGKAILFLRA